MTQSPPHSERATISVQEGQYCIEGNFGRRDEDWPHPADALTTGEDTWIAVITGTSSGPVMVESELLQQPPILSESGWEMIVERDVIAEADGLFLSPLFAGTGRRIEVRKGRYRVRVHVRDRATAAAYSILSEPLESHLLQIWPSDTPQPTRMLVGPDEYARTYFG